MKKTVLLLLLCALILGCCGCDLTNPDHTEVPEVSTETKTDDNKPAETTLPPETTVPATTAPAAPEGQELTGKWTLTDWVAGELRGYILTVFPDGDLQLTVQDADAQLVELYTGRWEAEKADTLQLQLTADAYLGRPTPKTMRCVYGFRMEEGTLLLHPEDGDPLIPYFADMDLEFTYSPLLADPEEPGETENTDTWDTEGLPRELYGQWMMEDQNENQRYSLTFYENGTVQYVVQDGIGNVLGLYRGRWMAAMGAVVQMQLIPDGATDLRDGRTIGCTYRIQAEREGLYLMETEQTGDLLIPHLTGRVLRFDAQTRVLEREALENDVWNAIYYYYDAVNGEPYPGNIIIEQWLDQETVQVHLYEELEDHTATLTWYTVNVYTLVGTDEMTGETIDFSPYWTSGVG